ncbi:MAG: aminoacyl-tRNA hydrolase, partial [Patescibacteria group bacterium]
LGNPGDEYVQTRHNVGRAALEAWRLARNWPAWSVDKKCLALATRGRVGKVDVWLLCPETMMNRSGESVGKVVKSKLAASALVVVHDDLDLPLGHCKISFGRGSGGHRGVESIIKKLKTPNFVRVRVGISPVTTAGRLKKPTGEKAVTDFILGRFKPTEEKILKPANQKLIEVFETLLTESSELAMNRFN